MCVGVGASHVGTAKKCVDRRKKGQNPVIVNACSNFCF